MVLGGWLAREDRYLRHNPPWFQKVLHKVNEDDDNKDSVNKCHPSAEGGLSLHSFNQMEVMSIIWRLDPHPDGVPNPNWGEMQLFTAGLMETKTWWL